MLRKVLSNVHTHTDFSDGRNKAEDMVLSAIQRGFVSLGFSDHGFTEYDSCSMSLETEKAYRAEICRLKEKYKGQIEIALGYEHDFHTPDTDLSPYDYVIESVHVFYRNGVYMPIDYTKDVFVSAVERLYGGDFFEMARDYFRCVCESIQNFPAQVVGHIELITKFNEDGSLLDVSDRRYVDAALETVHYAAEKDMLVEINTGAISRGYRTQPYPSPILLRELKRLGGRITITSDCHNADWLDFSFDQAAQLAVDAGFRETWIWKDGCFRPVPLEV